MELRPIFSTLRRHKTAAALIVLEVALTCAIVSNAIFMIAGRIERLHRPSGVVETELVRIELAGIAPRTDGAAQTAADLDTLRALPGVQSAAIVNQIPFGESSWNSSINLKAAQAQPTLNASMYMGDEHFARTAGLNLVAGRDFTADDVIAAPLVLRSDKPVPVPSVILTKVTAERLFPGEDPLGKEIHVFDDAPSRVIGIVEQLARPNELMEGPYAMIVPLRLAFNEGGNYLLRTDAAQRPQVLKAAVAALEKLDRNRIVLNQDLFTEIRARYYEQDRSMAWLLAGVCVALLIVTALGIVGLASFWVQQRTRMIGVRRALGATRAQILRYFQTENFLLSTIGIALGMLAAYAINLVLMAHYELPRLPFAYLPLGALALWTLGQVAVLGPALRAASVPPVVATRLA